MAEVTNRKINIYIETGAAQQAFDRLNSKAEQLQKELKETTSKGDIKRIESQLKALEVPINNARKKLSGEMAPSVVELKKLVNDLGNRMNRMSTSDADFSKVLTQYREARTQLQGIQSEINQVGEKQKGMTPFGASFAGNLAAQGIQKVASLVGDFFSGAKEEALQAEETAARFANTLDNLGATGAFDRLTAKADEMAQRFKYLDNDDVVGVFNQLIDYGKLTENQMNTLLPVIVNFAAKQRISIGDSASVIIKALEGNGKALKEYGIKLDTTGSSADNLKIIMGQLATKVDGAADAFQNTAAGSIASTDQQFKDLKETVGTQLLPVLTKLLQWTSDILTGLSYLGKRTKEIYTDLSAFFQNGIEGLALNQAQRALEQQQAINKKSD
jgi:hypothetical protein